MSIRGLLILLAVLLTGETSLAQGVRVDEDLVETVGVVKRVGRHITLYTDDRDRKDLDELVTVFDLAVNQWCDHFQIRHEKANAWHVKAYLMADEKKFAQAGLIPDDLPNFPAGYQSHDDIWLYPQPGNYYTRHLLLHEGTHAFMSHFLGNFGPPWYSEGMAEWLGLHRWDAKTGELKIGYRVKHRREADYWGRVKIVRDELAKGQGMTLDEVFNIEPTAFQKVRFYGWSWAACEFLANHPLTQNNFARLDRYVDEPAFKFRRKALSKLTSREKTRLKRDWNLYVHEIDYGYEVADGVASVAEPTDAADSLTSAGQQKYRVASERSWQDTGISVQAGDRVTISGSGLFQVKMTHRPWLSEAGGVTLKYYAGHPLGCLMAGVLPTAKTRLSNVNKPLIFPMAIGYRRTVDVTADGRLCLRINESPAQLNDNTGALEVTVEKLK